MHVCAQLRVNKREISMGGGLHMLTLSLSGLSAEFGDKVCVRGRSRWRTAEYWDMSSSARVWLLLYVVVGGARTPSAFLYAAMTALSRAVSPHQQPSILIVQTQSRSKRSILQITGRTGGARGALARRTVAAPCCAANAALRAER